MDQESPRQTKPKKGQFMNFSQGHSGTKVQCESCLFSQGKTTEFTKMGEIHELFVLPLSLVWFAGATPEWRMKAVRAESRGDPTPKLSRRNGASAIHTQVVKLLVKTHRITRRVPTKHNVAPNDTVRCRKWKVKTSIFGSQVWTCKDRSSASKTRAETLRNASTQARDWKVKSQ